MCFERLFLGVLVVFTFNLPHKIPNPFREIKRSLQLEEGLAQEAHNQVQQKLNDLEEKRHSVAQKHNHTNQKKEKVWRMIQQKLAVIREKRIFALAAQQRE